jgi:hypothetical protein
MNRESNDRLSFKMLFARILLLTTTNVRNVTQKRESSYRFSLNKMLSTCSLRALS